MQLELVVDKKDGRVLGMQGCCEDPESIKARVDAVAAVLQNKPFVKVEDISNLEVCYAPPFASAMDVVNAVGNVAENVLAGRIRPIAIICNTGLRSYDALLVLARHGITDVVQSMGGMQAVHELGASLDD